MSKYKEQLIECVEATRAHFVGKDVTPKSYFEHLEKEMRDKGLPNSSQVVHNFIIQQANKGGVWK